MTPQNKIHWPKGPTFWIKEQTLYASIPFTWNLMEIEREILRGYSFLYDKIILGGPAVYLMPDFFKNYSIITVAPSHEGVLQMVNPFATRTTVGCPNKCSFCGVRKFEPTFKELTDWPDLPIICDNNLLAASQQHFDKVIDRLKKHP
jgi:hypothetical protein